MNDPAKTTQVFADIAAYLRQIGLSPPEVFAHDPKGGFMIISDLGTTDFAQHLVANPAQESALYAVGVDVLVKLSQHDCALNLPRMTHSVASNMVNLAALHYAPDPTGKDDLCAALRATWDKYVDPELRLALRDYHAENLIWRPAQNNLDRVGLLDFQDACLAPVGYDLMSLIRDARRDVSPTTATAMITRFCNKIGRPVDDMSVHLACVGVQRNLRILGIFARLAQADGKLRYLSFLPRVWQCLQHDLNHPALHDLRKTVLGILPPPDTKTLERLRAR